MKKPKTRDTVFKLIEKNWPVAVTEIAKKIERSSDKLPIANVKYHFHQLEKEDKIRTKKIGRNLVAWPAEIERLRLIHEFLK